MAETTCYYHSDRIAVTVCERCKRPICQEDKRIYSESHYALNKVKSKNGRTLDFQGSTYDETHEYCPLCYGTHKKTTVIGALIGGGILIIIILLIFGIALYDEQSIGYIPNHSSIPQQPDLIAGFSTIIAVIALIIIILVILIIVGIVYIKKQKPNTKIICFECGSVIDVTDQFCPNCGNITKDEIRA